MQPIARKESPNEIIGLDGLRALSVWLVMSGHFDLQRLISPGLGVTVFFAISGFLITHLLLSEHERAGRVSLGAFYVRRFARLVPPLYVYIAVTVAVSVWLMNREVHGHQVSAALLYYTNYWHMFAEPGERSLGFQHLWSLAVEEHFYLLFPWLLWPLAGRLKWLLGAILAVILIVSVWRASGLYFGYVTAYEAYEATHMRIDSILWGCALAVAIRLPELQKLMRLLMGPVVVLTAGVIFFVYNAVSTAELVHMFRYLILGPCIAVLIGGVVLMPWTGWVQRALDLWPVRWSGKISYALYLWHILAIQLAWQIWAAPDEDKLWRILFAVAFSYAAASLSWVIVERPARAIRRRFGSHAVI